MGFGRFFVFCFVARAAGLDMHMFQEIRVSSRTGIEMGEGNNPKSKMQTAAEKTPKDSKKTAAT